jgi:hypothetical protein
MAPPMNEHPVTLHVYDDLRRSRLTVFFRPVLCAPHFVWLCLWTLVGGIFLIPSWLVALIVGRPASFFQRFFGAYLRYLTTVLAYLMLVANPFPGFLGRPGLYPLELEAPPTPEKQRRLLIFFRLVLVYPALLVSVAVLYTAVYPVMVLAWIVALITGRMPRGFRDFGANAVRYLGQVFAYVLLVTGRYPSASPYVGISLAAPVIAGTVEPPTESS